MEQALSPEISSITGQADQNRKQQSAMGTARGGGTDAINQQQQQNTQGQISQLINQARPQAAQQMQGIGAQELGTGSNLLGLGANAAGALTSDAGNSYATTSAQNQAAGSALGGLASSLLFGL